MWHRRQTEAEEACGTGGGSLSLSLSEADDLSIQHGHLETIGYYSTLFIDSTASPRSLVTPTRGVGESHRC